MRFGLAEIQTNGWLLRSQLTFADDEEAIAIAIEWGSRRGFDCVGVAD